MNRTKEAVARMKTIGPVALDVLSKRKRKRLAKSSLRRVHNVQRRTEKQARKAANRQKRAEEALKAKARPGKVGKGFTPPTAPAKPKSALFATSKGGR